MPFDEGSVPRSLVASSVRYAEATHCDGDCCGGGQTMSKRTLPSTTTCWPTSSLRWAKKSANGIGCPAAPFVAVVDPLEANVVTVVGWLVVLEAVPPPPDVD